MKHRSAISVFRPRHLAALLLLPAILAPSAQAVSHESHPSHESHSPIAFSLAPESAVTEYARKTWDFWSRAQADPALAAEFAEPQNSPDSPNPSHFVQPTPYLALRIDADPDFALPPLEHELPPDFPFDRLVCRFNIYSADTNQFPGLDLYSPVFAEIPRLYTERTTIPSLPATIPLPATLSDGGNLFTRPPRIIRHADYLIVRVTLELFLDPFNDPVPIAETILPPFTRRTSSILASTNLPADVWQSANESWNPWTPSPYPDAIPDSLPSRAPHTVVLSPEDLAALSGRPVLANRLALSGARVYVPGAERPRLPAEPPIPENTVLFSHPRSSAKNVSLPDLYHVNHDNPPSALAPLTAVRSAFPVYSAWLALPFLVSAAATVVLLVAVFRRAPARRSALWIVFPAAALVLALLFLVAGAVGLPRTPVADRILVRAGLDGAPEDWCLSSTRCISFRAADWTFNFPSADAGVNVYGLGDNLHLPFALLRDAARDATCLDFRRGVPSTSFQVEASWFAPADRPLQVRPPAEPPADDAPETQTREVFVSRDLDDLWVVISTNYYHVGPVPAGTTLHPRPWEIVTNNFPTLPNPFSLPTPKQNCGCPEPAPASNAVAIADPPPESPESQPSHESHESHESHSFQPAHPSWRWSPRTPWVTLARISAIEPPGLEISPETRTTAQTLWITEWP